MNTTINPHWGASERYASSTIDADVVAAATERWGEDWSVVAVESTPTIEGWLAEAYGCDDPEGGDLVYGEAIYAALDAAGLVGSVRDRFRQHEACGVALPHSADEFYALCERALASITIEGVAS
jgi:hypothetical protein